jgi:hypothetical protein
MSIRSARFASATIATIALSLAALVWTAAPAAADGLAGSTAAVPGVCVLPGADAQGNLTYGGVATSREVVVNGNTVTMTCTGNVTNLSSGAQSYRGWLCSIALPGGGSILTRDSLANVGEDGANDDGLARGKVGCTAKRPSPFSPFSP